MAEFQECLDTCELLEMTSRGAAHTWYNGQPLNPITRKLDRTLINEAWLSAFPQSTALYDAPGGSDHSPILVSMSDETPRRKVPFKFYSFFTSHPEYESLVTSAWTSQDTRVSAMFSLCQRMKAVKVACKALNRRSFSNIQARTAEAQEALTNVQSSILTAPTPSLFEEERVCRGRWLTLAAAEETFLREKSRVRWCLEGDSNTRFFHNSVKAHQLRNQIRSLISETDERVTDKGLLWYMIVDCYQQLHEEHSIGPTVIEAVREFFITGKLLKQINTTILALLPKTVAAKRLTEFRLISCCNTIYKVISRLLAKHLKIITSQAVQRNQVAFIPGRLLSENVLLASELIADFNKDGPTTRGCLQIDLSKAFDNVDWDFLTNILTALELLTMKGLRQGDSISAPLFTLVMDILSKQLDESVTRGTFQPHPKCQQPLITHLSFADDILVFFDGGENSLVEILRILTQFKASSGLGVNLTKSCLYLDGNNRGSISQMAARHNLTYGSLPMRYLGVPLTPHKLKPTDYQPLIDKVQSRISSWTSRHLSFAGRLQLLHSVINSTINFWASVFLLPNKCLEKLERICNAFLWNGVSSSARGAKVSWEVVCSPKASVGLGLKRLVNWNQAFALKMIWHLFSQAGSLWVSWVKHHLIRGRSFWEADFRTTGSWIWKRISKLRARARLFVHCSVISGSQALFWHDNWIGLGPLPEILGESGPRVTGIGLLDTVNDASNNNSWLIPRGRHPLVQLLKTCLHNQTPPQTNLGQDQFHWKLTPNESHSTFSTSRTWQQLHPPGPTVPWFSQVWFKNHIPKMAFIAWLTVHDRLTTRDRLRR
ncbi:PREDICTED: uncharacterized protein LOC104704630 [Camelina sativa]|uniref:Uncharacterized protein LOC104704630 n=1 Tax=Camelina sativa TaxID=90675 RepID=A0ABM0T0L9_CAMSA|nr:PREDICTED: uncharacterized protein LOC104704630 [Camelina sativa]